MFSRTTLLFSLNLVVSTLWNRAAALPPQVALARPKHPLQWGDINVLHTTDTHGWLMGHQKTTFPEPNYSGDLGELMSFVQHIKAEAIARGVDLLLVDTGDLHDGNGLTDGGPPGHVNAEESNKLFTQLPYDVLAIGNHEVYKYNVTLDMHQNFAPKFAGRYLSSNVNITVTNSGASYTAPVGARYAKFKTALGRRVTSLGVLVSFKANDAGTTVQPVSGMVKEPWFLDAISEEPDLFLLTGHMPVSYDEWPVVQAAIRALHPYTPILIFGGHTHIRDCVQYDEWTMAIESGQYMETLGWMSVDLPKANVPTTQPLNFSRRYLDMNRVSYQYHSNRTEEDFGTPEGVIVTNGLLELAKKFDLDYVFGTAPQDYYLHQAPYPSNSSLLSLYIDQVLPVSITHDNPRAINIPFIIVESGTLRFNIFKGPFTRNDQFILAAHKNDFVYIPNIPTSVARMAAEFLDTGVKPSSSFVVQDLEHRPAPTMLRPRTLYEEWLSRMQHHSSLPPVENEELTLGYVTEDSCEGAGDDIPHIPVPYHDAPRYVHTTLPEDLDEDMEKVDFVFNGFTRTAMLRALNVVQGDRVYTLADIELYSPLLLTDVFGVYAQLRWN